MTSQQINQQIPAGYRKNAVGDLVHEDRIKPVDKLRDEVVKTIVNNAKLLRQSMTEFKLTTMANINDFVELSSSEYGTKFGGAKGNILLTSFDGQYQVRRAVGEHRVFDERIQTAKTLIDDCIKSWSGGADTRLMAMVEHAFRVNQQGRIDVNQVLSLRQLDIDDPNWKQAMDAIADAIQITGTSQYLRLYERQPNGKYTQLPLDISTL
ncbi:MULTISPECIES: DUF3164 family protein [unclassified Shewanella]|uniref:DUF3164 family protein n=1 Tax=Shewanella cutis TaxID=2766780 RepID=A0ABS9QXW4_9GAMM|nr:MULTISPECIES: DUF3164 family protein [unclassified Shewanella]MCG9965187.1 DUF3164 family protein [Shewanella sp. PS-2]QRK80155.1 DUF3164 family protein [Shewanella sp. LZH-2]